MAPLVAGGVAGVGDWPSMQDYLIRIEGAEASAFRCRDGDTILSGALRSGIGYHYECNSGGCGSCQFELIEGELTELWPDAPGLSQRARERGRRLACQSIPASDITIRILSGPGEVPSIVPQRLLLSFAGSRSLTADMSEFRFRSAGPAEFLPGQFATFSLPGVEGARAYSMSNLPNAGGEWEFIVRRVPGGKGTAILFDALKPGDTLSADAPYGNSYLRTGNGRDIVCVAGGSGLSPVLSILRAAVRAPELSDRKLFFFYGGRGPEDICAPEIVSADPLLRERVELFTAISDEQAPGAQAWTGARGFVHELVKKVLGDRMPECDYYFCGPQPMTDAVHRMLLLEYKVPAKQLYFDRFF